MSTRIVVVPEDDRLDKYVLRPVFEAMLAHLGRPNAVVTVVDHPRPRGLNVVLDAGFAERVVRRFPMADVYVYCLDRDGDPGREHALAHLLGHLRDVARPTQRAEGVLARQEIEVWCLVNHVALLGVPWAEVRAHPHPKEAFFRPLVERELPVPARAPADRPWGSPPRAATTSSGPGAPNSSTWSGFSNPTCERRRRQRRATTAKGWAARRSLALV